MIASTRSFSPTTQQLQEQFLEILPRIENHGRIAFRHFKCSHRRADAIQEMQALGWHWFVRLAECGKDAREFVAAFLNYLVRAVKSGRKVAGMGKSRDAMNPHAQRVHSFKVEHLRTSTSTSCEQLYSHPHGQKEQDALEELLHDNHQTPPPDQAAFRSDFKRWRCTRTHRDRRMMDQLMVGERTLDVAKRFGLTPGRISQKRLEFFQDWQRFNGESEGTPDQPVAVKE